MREHEINLTSLSHRDVEQAIDEAIAASGLTITLRGSLKKFPGSLHWHLKLGPKPGTLEVTFWPAQHRAWFTIQSGRSADWIDEAVLTVRAALIRRGTARQDSR